MGNVFKSTSDQTDFYWDKYTDEPHASRRKLILAKYPQVKKLFGNDWRISIQLFFMVSIQFCMIYLVRDVSWLELVLFAYVIGGTLNHSLSLGLHEVAHNLAFGSKYPLSNRILGFFANLPLGVPASVTFKKYHLDHHKYQGDEQLDTDLPTRIEAIIFSSYIGKFFFVLLQPLFYSFRPIIVLPKKICGLEVTNLVIQLIFDYIVWYNFGAKSLSYLLLGTVLGLGLHPIAGHFIAEHYVFTKGFETYSYYGPLNLITFNVGYHNEHHDFPNIPGYRLPEVNLNFLILKY
jgi:sphingolipid 4-desaturase/C4-monooxygenase